MPREHRATVQHLEAGKAPRPPRRRGRPRRPSAQQRGRSALHVEPGHPIGGGAERRVEVRRRDVLAGGRHDDGEARVRVDLDARDRSQSGEGALDLERAGEASEPREARLVRHSLGRRRQGGGRGRGDRPRRAGEHQEARNDDEDEDGATMLHECSYRPRRGPSAALFSPSAIACIDPVAGRNARVCALLPVAPAGDPPARGHARRSGERCANVTVVASEAQSAIRADARRAAPRPQ